MTITSLAISAARASANTAMLRKRQRYSFSDFDSMQNLSGLYSMTTVAISGCAVTGQMDDTSSLVKRTKVTSAGAGNTST